MAVLTMLVSVAAISLAGCRETKAEEAMQAFCSSRYTRVVETEHHRIEVRYLPRTLQLLGRAELDGTTPLTAGLLDSLEAATGGTIGLLFLMRLIPRDSSRGSGFDGDLIYGKASGYSSIQESQHAYAFGLKSRIWLEVAGKKIPLSRYQMEDSFGMTRGRSFMLLFPPMSEGLRRKGFEAELVFDDIVPGLSRKKIPWTFPVGKYDESV